MVTSIRRALVALVGLVLVVVVAPLALVRVAQSRFGGGAPWSGLPPLTSWDPGVLGGPLADGALADVVIRIALAVGWVAVVSTVTTVVAETAHMVRHGGLAMPAVRGVGWCQPSARRIATGIVVLVSIVAPGRGLASPAPLPQRPVVPVESEVVAVVIASDPGARAGLLRLEPTVHVVEPGDSIYGIAGRLVGGDRSRVGAVADRILELNLGRTMVDGETFTNAALIHPGWVLELPVGLPAAQVVTCAPVVADVAPVEDVAPPTPTVAAPTTLSSTTTPTATTPITTTPITTMPSTLSPVADTPASTTPATDRPDAVVDDEAGRPIGLGHVAMLSTGVLALLAARRARRLRSSGSAARVPARRPESVALERSLRADVGVDRFERVDIAVRAAAPALVDAGAGVLAVLVAADGSVELVTNRPCVAPAPWTSSGDRWHLASGIPVELLAEVARTVGTPCPALVQVGTANDGRDVLVDLEAVGSLSIDAGDDSADQVLRGIVAVLATSVLAESAHLVTVGVDPASAVGHRHHHLAASVDEAHEVTSSLLGSTGATGRSTFELRVRHTGGEAWEPVIVAVGGGHQVDASVLTDASAASGLALLVTRGSGCRASLRATGAGWVFEPLGIELTPVGLTDDEVQELAELVAEADTSFEPIIDISAPVEIVEPLPSGPDWALMVRLFGGVEVVDRSGAAVPFERSKTRELVAWLATHRERSTRTAARTALWEMDVRDATFANVVSEARRAMARLVEPSPGSEWVGRTLTEDLPLHAGVVTDADVVQHAVATSKGRSVADAIEILAPAVELLRGMPFEGTSYLWPDAEGITSSLVLLGTGAAAELAAHFLSIGDVQGVFDATARGLAVLPGHEELIALRMRAHGVAGDRAGVRHEWERYERTIVADPWSDGEPAPKLVRLRQELLSSS